MKIVYSSSVVHVGVKFPHSVEKDRAMLHLLSVSFKDFKRFHKHVRVHENVFEGTHCLEWTGFKTEKGYGYFCTGSKKAGTYKCNRAHRWIFAATVEPIKGDNQIHHKCDNEWCVNVAHHKQVTNAENDFFKWQSIRAALALAR